MERMTMEQAVFRQQIVAIRDWDAYQAILLSQEGRQARRPGSLSKPAVGKGGWKGK